MEIIKKKHRQKITIIIASIACAVSIWSFILFIFPQVNRWNMNFEQKAFAGHEPSQLLLANFHYEIGDYSKSIFWYKVAEEQKPNNSSIALNNLGFLYSNRLGLVDNEVRYFEREALKYYLRAIEQDNKHAVFNAYAILSNNDSDRFPNFDYYGKLDEVRELFYDVFNLTPDFDPKWKFYDELLSPHSLTTYISENEKLISRGIRVIRGNTSQDVINNPSGTRYYVYALYIAAESGNFLNEVYCPINGDESILYETLDKLKAEE